MIKVNLFHVVVGPFVSEEVNNKGDKTMKRRSWKRVASQLKSQFEPSCDFSQSNIKTHWSIADNLETDGY